MNTLDRQKGQNTQGNGTNSGLLNLVQISQTFSSSVENGSHTPLPYQQTVPDSKLQPA